MSISAVTLRRLAALELSPKAMAEVLSIIADIEAPYEERRAKDAARKRGISAEPPRNIHGGGVENPVPRAGVTRADVSTTSSSVPIQENKEETSTSVSPKARRVRCEMPDDFIPDPATFEKARTRWGYSDADVGDRVEALREWSHGKGEKRNDWDAVVLGALRRDFEQAKKTGPPGRPTNGGKPTMGDLYLDLVTKRQERERQQQEPTNVIEYKALSH